MVTGKYIYETDDSVIINYHTIWLKVECKSAPVTQNEKRTRYCWSTRWMNRHNRHETTYDDPGLAVGGGPGKATEEKQCDELWWGSEREAFENLLKDKSNSLSCWMGFMPFNRRATVDVSCSSDCRTPQRRTTDRSGTLQQTTGGCTKACCNYSWEKTASFPPINLHYSP